MQSVSAISGSASQSERPVEQPEHQAGVAGGGLRQAIVVDADKVRGHVDEVVCSTVEATLNQLLDEEADRIAGAGQYERTANRQDTRAGSYRRKLQTKAGEVELTVPRLRTFAERKGPLFRTGEKTGLARCRGCKTRDEMHTLLPGGRGRNTAQACSVGS